MPNEYVSIILIFRMPACPHAAQCRSIPGHAGLFSVKNIRGLLSPMSK